MWPDFNLARRSAVGLLSSLLRHPSTTKKSRGTKRETSPTPIDLGVLVVSEFFHNLRSACSGRYYHSAGADDVSGAEHRADHEFPWGTVVGA